MIVFMFLFISILTLLMIDGLPLCPVFKGTKMNPKWLLNCTSPSGCLEFIPLIWGYKLRGVMLA